MRDRSASMLSDVRSTRRIFLQHGALGAALVASPLTKLLAAASPTITASSSAMSLIIKGRMFTGGRLVETGVRIENGVIVAVSPRELGPAHKVITLGPREVLLPAAVDTHCAMCLAIAWSWVATLRYSLRQLHIGVVLASRILVAEVERATRR